MKIAIVSNYFNHHQKPLCEEIYQRLGNDFVFISTTIMSQERKNLGYGFDKDPEFVLHIYIDEAERSIAEQWINDADIVIVGSAPEELLKYRKKSGKLIFRYSERPLKKGIEIHKFFYRWLKWHINNSSRSNCYMLCASAFTAADYAKFGLFKGKCFKWGYFPEIKKYDDLNKLIDEKRKNTLLWVGRFLNWKHPDAVIRLAKSLKESGYQFELNIIGTGEMELQLKKMIIDLKLKDCVHMLGSMKPEQVRKYMEKSEIYLFTSDRQEGWGAVLNESMNSGCAVVASHAIGSVPFLIKNRHNGYIYKDGNEDDLYNKVKYLLDNPDEQRRLGKAAYETIINEWNAEIAAKRLVNLAEHILAGEKSPDLYESGPCSKAEIIKDNWY